MATTRPRAARSIPGLEMDGSVFGSDDLTAEMREVDRARRLATSPANAKERHTETQVIAVSLRGRGKEQTLRRAIV